MASRRVAGYKAASTRASRSAEVAGNISPALTPLWNRVKGQFKGTLEQRTRGFKQYVHDHPKEVAAAQQGHADAKVAAMVARGRPDLAPRARRAGSPRGSSTSRSIRGGFASSGPSNLPDAPF